ncbi:GAP family protein [Geodermatophilus sp. SYSU D01186]
MSATLVAGIAGLALLDSLNPATIVGVALILITPLPRPAVVALAYVAGAYLTVLAAGAGVLLGAGAVAGLVTDGVVWVRRAALGLAALLLFVAAVRRLGTGRGREVRLPSWFGPWTAAPVGVMVTAADLPNAFPYLIAIERLLAADVATTPALTTLAAYAFIYCLPCLVLLTVGVACGERVRTRLRAVQEHLGRSRPEGRNTTQAALLALSAAGVGSIAVLA